MLDKVMLRALHAWYRQDPWVKALYAAVDTDMKSGRKMAEVKRFLVENALEAKMVENCGMDSEKLYFSTEEIPEQAGYYSLFIIKDESETQRKDRRKD